MLIQLHGAGFHNRGAQLMLWTAKERIRERLPEARFCVEPIFSNYRQRASYDLLTLAPHAPYASQWKLSMLLRLGSSVSRLIPKGEADIYGLARRGDVQALVDISGYAFGDKWPVAKLASMAKRVSEAKRRGIPAIFLPQMFGPFERPEVVEAFRPALEKASLVYARDETSLDWLKKINKTQRPLGIAPDITLFTDPLPPTELPETPYACLVPNQKMIEKGGDAWKGIYVQRMARVARLLKSRGVAPRILIHDGTPADQQVGRQLLEEIGTPDEPMLIEEDPRRIKGLVAGARMLVGSRFHAIVAAMSVGTPAIALGWAHKYETLMSDFGVAEYAYQPDQPESSLDSMIEKLAEDQTNAEVSNRILERKRGMKVASEAMWDEVAATLSGSA